MKVPCVRLQNIFLIMSNVIPNLTAVYQAGTSEVGNGLRDRDQLSKCVFCLCAMFFSSSGKAQTSIWNTAPVYLYAFEFIFWTKMKKCFKALVWLKR